MAAPLTLETLDIIGPDTYARDGYPHEAWKLLRMPIRYRLREA